MVDLFHSKRLYVPIFILWVVILTCVLIWLPGTGHIGGKIPIPQQSMQPGENGLYGYIFLVGQDRLPETGLSASSVILLEDDRFLGPGTVRRANIDKLGGGRFLFSEGSLYFSSSDKTDPRTNGRIYTLILPRPLSLRWVGWALFLTLFLFGWSAWVCTNNLKNQPRLYPWQFFVPIVCGLAVGLFYYLYFLQSDLLDIYLSSTLSLNLSAMLSTLTLYLQNHFPYIKKRAYNLTEFATAVFAKIHVFTEQYLLYICFLILILVFMITRLSFFLDYPIVGIHYDTETYGKLVSLIESGNLPLFEYRPPGYVLFLWLVTNIVDRWVFVVGMQSMIFLIANLCLVYGVYSLRRSLSLPATLAMSGFLGSSHVLMYELSALSDSLYTTCLIFIFAFLLISFGQCRTRYFVVSSLSIGLLISVRYAGMYALVVYFVILTYMFWNKYKMRFIVSFSVPLMTLLILWSTYNFFTFGRFSFILTGAYNVGAATAWFWEPDESFSPEVNDILRELPSDIKKFGITDAEQETLRKSWNPEELSPIFYKLYAPLVMSGWTRSRFADIDSADGNGAESIVKSLIKKSVLKHPDLYAKFIWTNLFYFYKDLELGKVDIYPVLANSSYNFLTDSNGGLYHLSGEISKEYYNMRTLEFASFQGAGEDVIVTLTDTNLKMLHMDWQSLHWKLFHQDFWVIAFFIVFGVGTTKLVISRYSHLGAFILFILSITVMGASLLTSLSEPSLERYAYPTEFIYYLSVALLPLLWLEGKNEIQNADLMIKG